MFKRMIFFPRIRALLLVDGRPLSMSSELKVSITDGAFAMRLERHPFHSVGLCGLAFAGLLASQEPAGAVVN